MKLSCNLYHNITFPSSLLITFLILINFGIFVPKFTIEQTNGQSSTALYSVIWSNEIHNGDNISYRITSTSPNSSVIFEKNESIIGVIGKLSEQVESGYHANLVSHFYYQNEEIPKNIIPPILIPKKVFRVCCNAYKPLTYQLNDWGWENFTHFQENDDTYELAFSSETLNARMLYNLDGVALSFNVTLEEFNYSAIFTSISPKNTDTSSILSQTTSWSIPNIVVLLLLIYSRRRIRND